MLKFNPDIENEEAIDNDKLPWLVFRIKHNLYAVNSDIISSIAILPEEITPIPESPEYIKGIVNVRGNVIPVVDTRVLFHIKSIEEEQKNFEEMLVARKKEHIEWVNELVRCYEQGETFTLATDPHMCKFGMWYDKFTTDNNQVMFHLNQIRNPHIELHECAVKLQEAMKESDHRETADEIFQTLKEELCPQIMKCLDETVSAVNDNARIMTITLEHSDEDRTVNVSLIVDQVLSVEQLDFLADNGKMKTFHDTRFVCGVAKSEKYPDKLISLVNEETMFAISENIDY